jgi:PilZ domain
MVLPIGKHQELLMARTDPANVEVHGATRRSERVRLRIPIDVEGRDERGVAFRERTHTLVINREGARITAEHSLQSGDTIKVTNLQTGASGPFLVVGPMGRSLGEEPEWGVEYLDPRQDFWGIYFPSGDASEVDPGQVDALVECDACQARELAKLTLDEYRALSSQGFLARYCHQCGEERNWKFGYVRALEQTVPPWDMEESASAGQVSDESDHRRAVRLAVKLPVRIRLQDGREEVTRTENLSKSGVCFVSDLEMSLGALIRLSLGYVLGNKEEEATARIVWRRPIEDSKRYLYGVHLEGPH